MFFKSAATIALTFVVSTFAFGLLTKDTQSKQEPAKAVEQNLAGSEAKSRSTAKEDDDAATPIVDLISSETTAPSNGRFLKNSQYDSQGMVKSEIDPDVANVIRQPLEIISDIPAGE